MKPIQKIVCNFQAVFVRINKKKKIARTDEEVATIDKRIFN